MSTNDAAVRAVVRLARIFETTLGAQTMTLAQFRLMAFLSEGESAASALADWLTMSRPSVTALVDGLVERGWVERRHSPTDRRRVLHQLTDAGRRELSAATDVLQSKLDIVLGHLDDTERDQALVGLDALSLGLRRMQDAKVAEPTAGAAS